MIDVMKRLAELDSKNPTIVKEGQVEECGIMPEMGMMGGMPERPPMPASINMTAGSGEELSDMLATIMQLAGVKQHGASPMGAEPLAAEPMVALTAEPEIGGDATSNMRSMIDKLNPMDGDDAGGDKVAGLDQDQDGDHDMGDHDLEKDDKEETDEQYDNSPADPRKPPSFDANRFAHQENQPGQGDRMDGTSPKAYADVNEATAELFAEYKAFVNEGEGDFGKAIGNLNGWYEVDPDQPNTRQYKFDDQEDEYYADGVVIQDLKTGKIKVEFNDKAGEYGGNNINDTFNSIGDAMNALGTLTTQKRYSGGKSYSRDSLASKSLAGPDDVYKTDRAGKIGTLTKSRMGNMKASSQYTMRGGPKGVLPEGKDGQDLDKVRKKYDKYD